jgi:hypothetical protein
MEFGPQLAEQALKGCRALPFAAILGAHAGLLLALRSPLAEGAIGADQRRGARLWRLQATLLDAVLEGAKGLQVRDGARCLLRLQQADVDEGIVSKRSTK